MRRFVARPAVGGAALLAAASLAAGGCGSSSTSSTPACFPKPGATGQGSAAATGRGSPAGADRGSPAGGWSLPGGNLQNTRDAASAITSSNVSKLGVAWTAPVEANGLGLEYAATPLVVNGVVYTQGLKSDVMAIRLATGQVLWTHTYNSLNGGPDGVNVAGGTWASISAGPSRPCGP